jgi:hypothetical protein
VGNFVWRDVKGDGYQNATGEMTTDVYGRPLRAIRTKSDGKYLFSLLPPGRYAVQITYPRGYLPTTANRPVRGMNSSTVMAISRTLNAGESDLTLDFGVVSRPGELYRALPATR